MTRHAIALAAAAALSFATLGSVSHAADETNHPSGQSSSITGGSGTMGQTGAANSSNTGTSGSNSALSGTGGTSGASGAANSSPNNVGPIGGEFSLNGSNADLHAAIQSANDPDKFFLVCAAIDNGAETELAQLAQQKSQDQQVKQFAQQLMRDHQQAMSQLQTACQETGVQMPRGLPMIKQQEMKVMQGLSGKEFDQHFISMIRAAHAKAVNEYQDVAQTAKDSHVKDYASKTLPMLQQHFQMAEKTATALGLPSSAEAQTAGARMPGESGSNSSNGMKSGSSGSSGR